MSYFRNFLILTLFFIPIQSFSDEKIEQSKFFVENLGKQVIEKVSNVNLSESERIVNFRNLYLDSFDNYYISRFVLGQYWKRLDSNMRKQFIESFNDSFVLIIFKAPYSEASLNPSIFFKGNQASLHLSIA